MAENSKIEWTDHTFNPWIGCTKVSPACDHCYAACSTPARTLGIEWGPHAERHRTAPATWAKPIAWNARAAEFEAQHGRRQRVFCASLADVFDNQVPVQWRFALMKLILATPNLDWLLLTKRVGNAAAMLETAFLALHGGREGWRDNVPPHVWLGATVCNQAEADRDIPKLLATPAAVRFVSIEPMLGPIDLERPRPGPDLDQGGGRMICQPWLIQSGIDWVICGGESGPNARPMHPQWARDLRDQCKNAGVPFLFKQHGEWLATAFCTDEQAVLPHRGLAYVRRDGTVHDGSAGVDFFGGDEEVTRVGKQAAGRLLDGVLHDGYPGDA